MLHCIIVYTCSRDGSGGALKHHGYLESEAYDQIQTDFDNLSKRCPGRHTLEAVYVSAADSEECLSLTMAFVEYATQAKALPRYHLAIATLELDSIAKLAPDLFKHGIRTM